MRRPNSMFRSRRGDVLLEYVILTMFVSIALLTVLHKHFYNIDQGYVRDDLGGDWSEHVKLLHRAIAMPLP